MAKPILIIDPGHGGKDPGGGTNQHWKEKDLVLKISLYQFNRYKELGVPVAITRNHDVYLSPEERTKIVRNSGATYCHSNHINAGKGDGAEVIHSIYDKTKMAQMIADEIKECGQNVRRVFTRTLPGNNRADYYFMIRDTGNVITNIIEYGFADSPKDDVQQLLDHWKDYAEAVVKAFCEFIGHKYAAPGKESGKVDKNQPSEWAKSVWDKQVKQGYFDGTNPQDGLTREQGAALIDRLVNNIKKYHIAPLETKIKELENTVIELSK